MNSRLLRQWSCRPAIRHVPDLFFLDRSSIDNLKIAVDSRQIYENTVSWVTSRFSSASDDLLFLADDFGQLVLIDISQFDKPLPPNAICSHLIRAKVQAHSAAVIDIVNVPGRPNEILTFSGDTQVKIWDVSTGQMQLFFGHQRTVKCGSFIPDSPFVFVTGSKAGDVQVWDRRVVEVQKKNLKGRRSVLSCDKAFKESNNQPSCPAVTGIACTSEVTVVAGSANLNCGLKVFDLRKPNLNKPSAWISTYKMPNMHKAREGVGITSLCLDRHSASLFASARSHRIYEFAANSSIQDPGFVASSIFFNILHFCFASKTILSFFFSKISNSWLKISEIIQTISFFSLSTL
ncbi:hypothetical protein WR25_05661 [Diploscapter pachys]|uniref:Uncharacterized protein n=1 Tax=Diploscapter pachys TaxID=2018661 RepID=A0A2A2LVK2_9BILA|nr:hypothetical protein WR25_05661 [Diploscapter pachys]